MNTKTTKTSLSKKVLAYAHELQKHIDDVYNYDTSLESKMLYYFNQCKTLLDDLVSIGNIIKKDL